MDTQLKADTFWLVVEIKTSIGLRMVYPPTTRGKHNVGQSQRYIQIQTLYFKALIPGSLGWLSSVLLLKRAEVNPFHAMQHCLGNPTATAGTQVRAAPLNYWPCFCMEIQGHHSVTQHTCCTLAFCPGIVADTSEVLLPTDKAQCGGWE